MVDDTLAVTDYLRDRFDQPKIYLRRQLLGTMIGVQAVQHSPQLFHAYVGTGQMVDPFETDELMYAESLEDAEARGDDGATGALGTSDRLRTTTRWPTRWPSPRTRSWIDFEHGDDYEATSEYPSSLFVGEYTLIEQLRGMAAIAETFQVLYPQLAGHRLPRPGRPPRRTRPHRPGCARGLRQGAPRAGVVRHAVCPSTKHYTVFEQSGTSRPHDEPGRFAAYMQDVHDQVEGPAP